MRPFKEIKSLFSTLYDQINLNSNTFSHLNSIAHGMRGSRSGGIAIVVFL